MGPDDGPTAVKSDSTWLMSGDDRAKTSLYDAACSTNFRMPRASGPRKLRGVSAGTPVSDGGTGDVDPTMSCSRRARCNEVSRSDARSSGSPHTGTSRMMCEEGRGQCAGEIESTQWLTVRPTSPHSRPNPQQLAQRICCRATEAAQTRGQALHERARLNKPLQLRQAIGRHFLGVGPRALCGPATWMSWRRWRRASTRAPGRHVGPIPRHAEGAMWHYVFLAGSCPCPAAPPAAPSWQRCAI